jgi:hypothetical protein
MKDMKYKTQDKKKKQKTLQISILENIQQNNDYGMDTSKDWQTANSLHKCFSGYCLDMGKGKKEPLNEGNF